MKLEYCDKNRRVCYIPTHAYGDPNHPDAEMGTVSSRNDRFVFVKFDRQLRKFGWDGTTAQSCDPRDLHVVKEDTRREIVDWMPESSIDWQPDPAQK